MKLSDAEKLYKKETGADIFIGGYSASSTYAFVEWLASKIPEKGDKPETKGYNPPPTHKVKKPKPAPVYPEVKKKGGKEVSNDWNIGQAAKTSYETWIKEYKSGTITESMFWMFVANAVLKARGDKELYDLDTIANEDTFTRKPRKAKKQKDTTQRLCKLCHKRFRSYNTNYDVCDKCVANGL